MIFKFQILSDEVENFQREIVIDADATFLNLYQAILDCTGFGKEELASFFLCDEKWRKLKEITIIEMETYSDEDSYVMEDCVLSDFLEDEGQKLIYMFDYLYERALYMELSEIIPGKHQKQPSCTLSVGKAPEQSIHPEEMKEDGGLSDMGETFYGDEKFEMNELDKEGFDGLDNISLDEEEEGDLY